MISRAAENQRFVLSCNTAHPLQKCPTLAVNPKGNVLAELQSAGVQTARLSLELNLTLNWYLDQARRDVVAVMSG